MSEADNVLARFEESPDTNHNRQAGPSWPKDAAQISFGIIWLDVASGEPEDFSLPAGDDLHFVTRSPACASPDAPDENALSSSP